MPLKIEDYALIGDCQTVALVGKNGSIDWMCVPRFDSAACFAALLGTPEHGRWLVAPAEPIRRVTRHYRDSTLVLETEFETETGGVVSVIDFMPPRAGTRAPDLVRIIEGRRGKVCMGTDLTIRFDYGSIVPWGRHANHGIRAVAGPETMYLRSPDVDLRGRGLHTQAEFEVSEGQRVRFCLTWTDTQSPEPPDRDCDKALEETEAAWRGWAGRCTYDGRWREPVMRSLITLK